MFTQDRTRFCPWCGTELTQGADDEGRARTVCPNTSCGYVHYRNPTPVAAMLVQQGEAVILARNARWPKGMLSLITGFVEEGEHPRDTALRETREELGLEVDRAELIGVYTFAPLNQVIIAYHLEADADAKVVLSPELVEFKRVPITKLRPWPVGPGPAVADWLAQRKARG